VLCRVPQFQQLKEIYWQGVVNTLLTDPSDESFDFFWASISQRKHKGIKSIKDPVPPRKRKEPERFELGNRQRAAEQSPITVLRG